MIKLYEVLIILTILCAGCAAIEKYLDEATHGCTHEKDGKKKGPVPMKLKAGEPIAWEEDGWKITCEPYDKE
jgi:hypothetical protein